MDGHGAAAADDSSPIYGRSGFLAASSHGRGFTTSDSWDEASGGSALSPFGRPSISPAFGRQLIFGFSSLLDISMSMNFDLLV